MLLKRKIKHINIDIQGASIAPLLVSVCDDNYFHYVRALVLSADLFSPGMEIVVHLINPTTHTIAQAEQLKLSLANTTLHISTETTELEGASDSDYKTYYASARFLLINELLHKYTREIFCLDADSLIINPFDNNFTDKAEADICLVRRDIEGEKRANLKVATGSIYVRTTPNSKKFFNYLSKNLLLRIECGNLPWFTDQVLFSEQMEATTATAVRNIKRKYADWNFSLNSIVWAGKGESKSTNLNFLLLQNLLLSSAGEENSLESAIALIGRTAFANTNVSKKFTETLTLKTPRVTILLPRLDLPWKRHANLQKIPKISESAIALRSQWKIFSILLANAFQSQGFSVNIQELPAWEINNSIFDRIHADVIFIPHKCRHEFSGKLIDRPVYFYMQEFFSWLFTVDARGWSAASSIYPINYQEIPDCDSKKYNHLRHTLLSNNLESKFSQPYSQPIAELVNAGEIPRHSDPRVPYKNFIFFPLQIPTDQSILYFSDYSEELVVESLLTWSKSSRVPIVFKPHPASPKSMTGLIEKIKAEGGYITNANIHDLIELSSAVYTINSGVGFEALFHNKPIVTFGKVEYDCCTFKATPDKLEMAWIYCLLCSKNDLLKGYQKFVDWFISGYAYDISDYEEVTKRLRMLAKRIKNKHFTTKELQND